MITFFVILGIFNIGCLLSRGTKTFRILDEKKEWVETTDGNVLCQLVEISTQHECFFLPLFKEKRVWHRAVFGGQLYAGGSWMGEL